VLRRDRENEVVGGSDVCQDEGWVFDVSMGGAGLVGHLECAVCSLLAVVGCSREAEDYQPVRRRVRLHEDRLLPGLLLAPDLEHVDGDALLCGWDRGRWWCEYDWWWAGGTPPK